MTDELEPDLRNAIDAVLKDDPPSDWMEESLDKLRQTRHQPGPGKSRGVIAAIVLATAACVLVVLFMNPFRTNDDGQEYVDQPEDAPEQELVNEEPIVPERFDRDAPVRPTLWAYQQAAIDSPETLDELLEEHAGRLLRPTSDRELAGLY
jgi:hypothetical protein